MLIKSFEPTRYIRYLLDDKALTVAASDVAKIYAQARGNSWPSKEIAEMPRTVSIFRLPQQSSVSTGNQGQEVKYVTHGYRAVVEYASPLLLTPELISFELSQLRSTDLFVDDHSVQRAVRPAGLELFTEPWSCHETWRAIRTEEDLKAHSEVSIQITGVLHNAEQAVELSALGNRLYLPIDNKDGTWTSPDQGGSSTNEVPHITIVKYVREDLADGGEKVARQFYEDVKTFVLRHKVSEDFRCPAKSYAQGHWGTKDWTWSEMVDKVYAQNGSKAPRLRESIASSHIEDQVMWYAPWANVRTDIIGAQERYPRAVLDREERSTLMPWARKLRVSARPRHSEPEIIVMPNGWAWRSEKS